MAITRFPARFGKYILLDPLAAGGMAEVYVGKAIATEQFERLVAIKCMLPHVAKDPEFVAMFVDEAKLAGQLNHANIVQIFELGTTSEQLYIAMELVQGADLRSVVKRAQKAGTKLPLEFVAYLVECAARALDYAHMKCNLEGEPLGLVHRDVSPQNILIGYDGAVKVVDFGIAKAEFRATETRAGMLKGKFAYMAPEQVTTGLVDRRTDIFALGAVLYEALAGRPMFAAESDFSVLEKVREARVPKLLAARGDLPAEVEAIWSRAVARDPNARFDRASDMADALSGLRITGERRIFSAQQASRLMHQLYDAEVRELSSKLRRYAHTTVDQCADEARASVGIDAPTTATPKLTETALEARSAPARRRTDPTSMDEVRPTVIEHRPTEQDDGSRLEQFRAVVAEQRRGQRATTDPSPIVGLTSAPATVENETSATRADGAALAREPISDADRTGYIPRFVDTPGPKPLGTEPSRSRAAEARGESSGSQRRPDAPGREASNGALKRPETLAHTSSEVPTVDPLAPTMEPAPQVDDDWGAKTVASEPQRLDHVRASLPKIITTEGPSSSGSELGAKAELAPVVAPPTGEVSGMRRAPALTDPAEGRRISTGLTQLLQKRSARFTLFGVVGTIVALVVALTVVIVRTNLARRSSKVQQVVEVMPEKQPAETALGAASRRDAADEQPAPPAATQPSESGAAAGAQAAASEASGDEGQKGARKFGYVRVAVNGSPSARVFINGRDVGLSPVVERVRIGRHRVKVVDESVATGRGRPVVTEAVVTAKHVKAEPLELVVSLVGNK